jgi:putative serine/threonine protein kinase
MLRLANSVNVGPRLLSYSNRFLVMEYLEGKTLPEWVEGLAGRGRKGRLKTVLGKILEACYILDQIGLDHGELSRAPKHIIVSSQDEPEIVDFETASANRKPSNVTSIAQYLFIGSNLSARVRRILGPIRRQSLVAALRQYKKSGKFENLQRVLKVIS